jgi:hypothetical protein
MPVSYTLHQGLELIRMDLDELLVIARLKRDMGQAAEGLVQYRLYPVGLAEGWHRAVITVTEKPFDLATASRKPSLSLSSTPLAI